MRDYILMTNFNASDFAYHATLFIEFIMDNAGSFVSDVYLFCACLLYSPNYNQFAF